MAWATAQDVIDAWIGDDAPSNTASIELWLAKAEREVKFRIPDIEARMDAEAALIPPSTVLLDNAIDVVVAMVIRKFRNPEGTRQVSVTTGPFSEQRTYGGNAPGDLSMLDSEVDKLSADSGDSHRAFSIDLLPVTSRFSPYYEPAYPWL